MALGEKFFWWSRHFDVNEDTTPDLTLRAITLNNNGGPPLEVTNTRATNPYERATNAYEASIGWAMLVGFQLPPACWQITAEYLGYTQTIVIYVPVP
jgi:hypothetical protein